MSKKRWRVLLITVFSVICLLVVGRDQYWKLVADGTINQINFGGSTPVSPPPVPPHVSIPHASQEPPLIQAVGRGDEATVKQLLAQGADVNVKDAAGATALQVAASYPIPRTAIYYLLRSKGVAPDLQSAIEVEDIVTIKALLAKGIDVDKALPGWRPGSSGPTPLMAAINAKHVKVVRLLLEKGANPNTADSTGALPLVHASGSGNLEVAQALLDKGADVNLGMRHTEARLPGQSELRDLRTMEADGSGANKISVDHVPLQLLASSVQSGPSFVRKVRYEDSFEPASAVHTPLVAAIGRKDKAMYRLLRQHHARDVLDVYAAAAIGDIDTLKALMKQGVSLNSPNEQHDMPVTVAVGRNQTAMVSFLLDHGATINSLDLNGDTLLTLAALCGYDGMIDVLVDHGANLDSFGLSNQTALMKVAFSDNLSCLQKLLARGANVNAQRSGGQTALMYAVRANHPEMVQTLLKHGADVTIKTAKGQTALSFAQQLHLTSIIQFLQGTTPPLQSKEAMPPLWRQPGRM